MRLAIISEGWFPYIGGGQVYGREVAKRLIEAHGYHVTLITRSLRDGAGRAWTAPEEAYDGKLRIIRLGSPRPFFHTIGRLLFLLHAFLFLLRHRFDVLNPQSTLPGLPAKLAGMLRRTPVVYAVHGTALFLPPPTRFAKKVERWVERFLLLGIRYDAEVTVAKNFLKLPNRNRRIVVIPPGVDVQPFDTLSVPKKEKFTILFIGRFDAIKGLRDLLEAVGHLGQQTVPWELLLVGEGTEEPKLKAKVATDKLENVRFAGRLEGEALIRMYKAAHLFVLPSYTEGFPLTLLEAMAAKLPIVATDVGDVRDLVEDDVTGFLVPAGKPEVLATAITHAMHHPHLAALGENGYTRVRERYRWDETAQRLAVLFREFLQKRR